MVFVDVIDALNKIEMIVDFNVGVCWLGVFDVEVDLEVVCVALVAEDVLAPSE